MHFGKFHIIATKTTTCPRQEGSRVQGSGEERRNALNGPGVFLGRGNPWRYCITRCKVEKVHRNYSRVDGEAAGMLESLEENPVLLYDFHADEDRWPDAHGPEIADSEDEGLLSE